MKSILVSILILILVLLLGGTAAFAEMPDAAWQELMDSEYILLDDAWEKIGQLESDDPQIVEMQETLSNLRLCDGRYVQLPDEDGTGKIYSADVVFYLKKGVPHCNIDYTNYGGTISDGKVEAAEGEYLFVSHPDGAFFSNNTVFTFEFAPEKLHILWAEGTCEYMLERGTDEQQASANYEPPFVETDMYAKLMQAVDKAFGSMDYTADYDENTKTLTVYVGCGAGYKTLLTTNAAALQEAWMGVINSIITFSENMDEALTLATRKGLTDFTQAQFTVIFVETIEAGRSYTEDDHLAVITDGVVTYNIVEESLKAAEAASQPTTIGETNALRSAKRYIEIMPFSYEGLVEQLEYEGYSHSEAVFGASNCGANWYEQAVKSAKKYLELMPFSRSGLIEQLEYEGYTHDQAVYGAEKNGY